MTVDPFKELREQPYPLFTAPRPYSFDLNEDMVNMIREEFNADVISGKLAEALGDKTGDEAKKAGEELFTELGKQWMSKTIQLGEEYSDRTIEVVLETVDRNGEQFMIFPHVPQRFVEIAYLTGQFYCFTHFRRLPKNRDCIVPDAHRPFECDYEGARRARRDRRDLLGGS